MTNTPTTTRELYELLLQAPGLCGRLTLESEGNLRWDLWEGYHLAISIYKGHGHISLDKNGFFNCSVTHWHPEPEEILEELLSIGKTGNLLVIRRSLLGEAVAHMGPEEECPRRAKRKGLFSRPLILKAQ